MSCLGAVGLGSPAAASPPGPRRPVPPATSDRVTDPDRTLGRSWRTSDDRAVTTSTDETGLHILVADRHDAYRWRTAATLAEPGVDTDQWIGQFCVTGLGRRAVVVYAPRQFANRESTMAGGGYAAVVDLTSGDVMKLAGRVTLAYYNPGCGSAETAVLSRLTATGVELSTVDAASGRVVRSVRTAVPVSSAVPVGDRVVGAVGGALVEVRPDGRTTVLARTAGTPYRVLADGRDALAFQLPSGRDTVFSRYAGGRITRVGSAPAGSATLRPGAGGRVFVVGSRIGGLPRGWQALDGRPDSDVSTTGGLVVTSALTHQEAAPGATGRAVDGHADRVRITARLGDGAGGDLTFGVTPAPAAARAGRTPNRTPGPGGPTPPRRPGSPTDPSTVPWDPDRACAVPRNDPTVQTYQPSPAQVEWAADLAVRGQLTFSRPAGWLNDGLPAFSPQGLFPAPALDGGGTIPAQVLLGILAQESNLRQASWHVVDGSSGNPLTSSGFYGLDPANPDPDHINWSTVDCGYGVGQVTTGMLRTDTGVVLSDLQQKAVAVDYATNVAASARLLGNKWNDTRTAGIVANNGDPRYIENWFLAVWAYNSGLHPRQADPSAPWGLGWLNNPANPIYPADRQPFLTAPLTTATHQDQIAYDNAKHPNDWSYPERVMGWARTSAILPNYASGTWESTYATGVWPGDSAGNPDYASFVAAQPGRFTFCVPDVNNCDPAVSRRSGDPNYADQPPGPCTRDDLTECWWHGRTTWIDCPSRCGQEVRPYTSVEPRPLADNIHPEQCAVIGLPSNALIVDDIATSRPLGPDGCPPVASGGRFALSFASTVYNGATIFPSKVDFHQIGAGFGGHLWFTHTEPVSADTLRVTGTWTPANRLNAWTRVFVHLPDTGAQTQQARYVVHTGAGDRYRYLPQNRDTNAWVELGTYEFGGTGVQRLELSNVTDDGSGVDDIAWDAAAFVPLAAKPANFVVALGDSFESGEGAGGYYPGTDVSYEDYSWNACRRSAQAWPRQTVLPGTGTSIGQLADSYDARLDFQFVSCSNAAADRMAATTPPPYWTARPATLGDFHRVADGQFHEHAQVDSGVLGPDTTLVLLSAGGNDARFPDWMSRCAAEDCSGAANQAAGQHDVDDAQPRIGALIQAVHSWAPSARIVLVGYPRLFASYHTDSCGYTRYSADEMDMLNGLAEYMRTAQSRTVGTLAGQGVPVRFVDMVVGFQDEGVCRRYDTAHDVPVPENINAVVVGPTGPGDFAPVPGDDQAHCVDWIVPVATVCVSRASFHPKDTGMPVYAQAVSAGLA
jgi:hypothetical protein